ncbi:DUF5947 family protein [Sulfobacillus thermosulfidooxidans]|uniref:DUF5947 family protein n=1 Tax=Sulfobacillus thermosulfidooxidans TaxID=28034 RepID=UPI00096BCEB1|nr:DUF5947 family protein [Sulfobacillus thermosulfidooxidans]OLZ11328.1 hypothetical protein BFX05_07565 [Sulfobacillus thermosulfidooxidans]OLZ14074.1 hypothetical protein BFX06_07115 [Sulfobacillus thermosulfidooxidans]OLZ19834.1 hypothetical protein BFX07_01745 [Sulfobacillus thermosulfidooxidans]
MPRSILRVKNWVREDSTRTEEDVCEVCNRLIPQTGHRHLLRLQTGQVVCACQHCALLFDAPGQSQYQSIPTRIISLGRAMLDMEFWDRISSPVHLVGIVKRRGGQAEIFYPSPAGAVSGGPISREFLTLPLQEALDTMSDEVEVLLFADLSGMTEGFLIPLDRFYELIGLLRLNWQGLSGGNDVSRRIRQFFDQLARQAPSRGGLA